MTYVRVLSLWLQSCATRYRVRWCCDVRVGSSVVSVMTTPQVGRYRVRIPVSARVLSLLQIIQTVSKTHPASYSVGAGGFLPGVVSQTGRELYHSPLTSAEVKNDCSYRHMPSRSGQRQLYIHLCVQRHSSLSPFAASERLSFKQDIPETRQTMRRNSYSHGKAKNITCFKCVCV